MEKIELIVHDKIDQNGMAMWGVATNTDCLKNYHTVFGDNGIRNLFNGIELMQRDFYEIKRYFQFVGIFEYHHTLNMYTMKLFEPTSSDSHLDAYNKLINEKWNKEDLISISKISEEILHDTSLVRASLVIYDPIEKFKNEKGM